jgi:hypothetical protein
VSRGCWALNAEHQVVRTENICRSKFFGVDNAKLAGLRCQSLSHRYFCAKFIQNSKEIPDLFPLGKMLSLVGQKDPQEELSLDSILSRDWHG